MERELRGFTGNREPSAIKQKMDTLEDQLLALTTRHQQTTQNKEEVKALQAQIVEFTQRLQECQNIITKETKTIQEVQSKNDKSNRENLLKAADNEVKKLTKKASASRNEVLKRKEEYDSLKLELTDLNAVIAGNREQIEKHKKKIEALEKEGRDLSVKVAEAKEAVDKVRSELKSLKDVINKKSKEITKLLQSRDKIGKEATALELEIKQDQKDHDKLKQEAKDSRSRVAELLKEHDWIAQEEQFFGKPNGVYDFNETDPHEAGRRLVKLRELKDKLGRTLNTKAMNLLAKTEEQYNDLMKKRQQVEQDKQKILEVIEELGEKKKVTLRQACVQVRLFSFDPYTFQQAAL